MDAITEDAPRMDPLLRAQIARERAMVRQGAERVRLQREMTAENRGGSALKPHQKLIQGAVPGVAEYVAAWCTDTRAAPGRKKPQGLLPLEQLEPDTVAYIGLLVAFDALTAQKDLRWACKKMGAMIQDELWTADLLRQDQKLFKRLFGYIGKKEATPRGRRKAVARAEAKFSAEQWERWDDVRMVRVGEPVLNAVLLGAGVFEPLTVGRQKLLTLTEEARAWVTDMDFQAEWSRPVYGPMVVPPRPWRSHGEGPWITKELRRSTPLVRTFDRQHIQLVDERIADGSMQPVLDTLNAIQETPFSINRPVMALVEWAFEQEVHLKKFPRRSLVDTPERPKDLDDEDIRQQIHFKHKLRAVKVRNLAIESGALSFRRDVATAKELSEYPAFYLPHNLDFRGRIYPIPSFNQQREDHVKAMIEFAEGVPLGDRGHYWLAIHLANVGGFEKIDKQPLQDRYDWVLQHQEQILKTAENPYEYQELWTQADKPFSFYAACLEWAAYTREGGQFRSRIGIALDGSNSGLQHYSAALRAEEDARYVNLRDFPTNQDIYQAVADHVTGVLQKIVRKGPEDDHESWLFAQQWLQVGVTRSTVKRNVMTFPYSSEVFGFAEQLRSDFMKPLSEAVMEGTLDSHPFGEDEGYRASIFMAKLVWGGVTTIVSKAGEGMRFLQGVAAALAHEFEPMTWTTPVGFPVVHKYNEWDVREIELFVAGRKTPALGYTSDTSDDDPLSIMSSKDRVDDDGNLFKRVKFNLRTRPSSRINKKKQRSAVAPNVIHSLDAAHLLGTVQKARTEDIRSFMLIHDSFATHAGRTERFFSIIREAFVEMYEEHDLFADILEAARETLSPDGAERLPDLPDMGSLDLSEVTRSQFAFC